MRLKQKFAVTAKNIPSTSQERVPGILKRTRRRILKTDDASVTASSDPVNHLQRHETGKSCDGEPLEGIVRPLTDEEQQSLFILVGDEHSTAVDPTEEVHDDSETLVVHVKRVSKKDSIAVSGFDGNNEEEPPPEDPKNVEQTAFVGINGKTYKQLRNPKLVKTKRGNTPLRWFEDSPTDKYQCLLCGNSMESRALTFHMHRRHDFRLPSIAKAAFVKYIRKEKLPVATFTAPKYREGTGECPECHLVYNRRLDLLGHLSSEHQRTYFIFDFEFDNTEQFDQWLQTVLRDYKTGYTKNRTNISPSGVKTQMFLCRMEAQPRKERSCKTDRRARTRTRVPYCTAHLLVKFLKDGRLHVRGSPTHLNHEANHFYACRSLDNVPMDGLPGYTSVISSHANGIPRITLDFCQRILKKIDAIKSLLTRCPIPSNDITLRLLHTNLATLDFALTTYKYRALVVQGQSAES